MTPFDVTYAHEFLVQQAPAADMTFQTAPAPPPAPAQPRSMLTPSTTEYLLQRLDKDSVMTGLVVIAAYVALIQAL